MDVDLANYGKKITKTSLENEVRAFFEVMKKKDVWQDKYEYPQETIKDYKLWVQKKEERHFKKVQKDNKIEALQRKLEEMTFEKAREKIRLKKKMRQMEQEKLMIKETRNQFKVQYVHRERERSSKLRKEKEELKEKLESM